MELRHLRYFVAVAEELHFGRAATKLHISQPPLSHQVRDLERELGVTLLKRTRHSVSLTEAGRAFLEEARRILSDSDHAMATARRVGRGEVGHLSIGFGPLLAVGILGRIINAFLSAHPEVRLDLQTLNTAEQIEALVGGRIDAAFPILPVSHPNVATEAVATEPLVAALPTGHRRARASRVSLADLKVDPFVGISRSAAPTFHDLVVRACGDAGFAPSVEHEASYVLTVLGLVGAGLGVAMVPAWVAARETEGVAFRPLSGTSPIRIGVAHRRSDPSTPLRAFLEAVRNVSRLHPVRDLRASAGA
jgi:DNA-binding transcriptional LysR family regulator